MKLKIEKWFYHLVARDWALVLVGIVLTVLTYYLFPAMVEKVGLPVMVCLVAIPLLMIRYYWRRTAKGFVLVEEKMIHLEHDSKLSTGGSSLISTFWSWWNSGDSFLELLTTRWFDQHFNERLLILLDRLQALPEENFMGVRALDATEPLKRVDYFLSKKLQADLLTVDQKKLQKKCQWVLSSLKAKHLNRQESFYTQKSNLTTVERYLGSLLARYHACMFPVRDHCQMIVQLLSNREDFDSFDVVISVLRHHVEWGYYKFE